MLLVSLRIDRRREVHVLPGHRTGRWRLGREVVAPPARLPVARSCLARPGCGRGIAFAANAGGPSWSERARTGAAWANWLEAACSLSAARRHAAVCSAWR